MEKITHTVLFHPSPPSVLLCRIKSGPRLLGQIEQHHHVKCFGIQAIVDFTNCKMLP